VDDYKVGLLYNLKVDNPVGGNGVYLPTSPLFAGEHIYKANPQIIAALGEANKLWAHKPSSIATRTAGVIKLRLSSVRPHNGSSAWMPKVYVKVH
jgi:Isoleucyl-tRNA synthetase